MKKILLLLFVFSLSVVGYTQIVRSCYNIGKVMSGGTKKGGIVGDLSDRTIVDNKTVFYLNDMINGNAFGTEKSPIDLKATTSLLNGSQLMTIWKQDSDLNNGEYPILIWQDFTISHLAESKMDQCDLFYSDNDGVINIYNAIGANVILYNMQGVVCYHQKILDHLFTITIADWQTGIYFITLINDYMRFTKTIIKSKIR